MFYAFPVMKLKDLDAVVMRRILGKPSHYEFFFFFFFLCVCSLFRIKTFKDYFTSLLLLLQ